MFAVIFLSSVIVGLIIAVAALSAVVYANLLDIDTLKLHLLTESREEEKQKKIHNTYNMTVKHNPGIDTEIALADLQALFNKMPTRESEQLADVIKLHGDKMTDKKEKKDD